MLQRPGISLPKVAKGNVQLDKSFVCYGTRQLRSSRATKSTVPTTENLMMSSLYRIDFA